MCRGQIAIDKDSLDSLGAWVWLRQEHASYLLNTCSACPELGADGPR